MTSEQLAKHSALVSTWNTKKYVILIFNSVRWNNPCFFPGPSIAPFFKGPFPNLCLKFLVSSLLALRWIRMAPGDYNIHFGCQFVYESISFTHLWGWTSYIFTNFVLNSKIARVGIWLLSIKAIHRPWKTEFLNKSFHIFKKEDIVPSLNLWKDDLVRHCKTLISLSLVNIIILFV